MSDFPRRTAVTRPLILLLIVLTVRPLFAQGMPPASVELGKVQRESVRTEISGVASVTPFRRVVVCAEIAGVVAEYPLREGDEVVAKETILCEMMKTDLQIDLDEASALLARAVAEAEASVETAHATMEEMRALHDRAEKDEVRARSLFEKMVINKSELDLAEAEAISARFRFQRAERTYELAKQGSDPTSKALLADVRRARARLDRVKESIEKASIVSLISGVVAARHTEKGGWLNPGDPVLEVVTLHPVLVRIAVNERQIGAVRTGDEAVVTVEAWAGRRFSGKVRHITPQADASRAFPVLIEVENPETLLLAGMFARVELMAGASLDVLTVPKDALVEGRAGTMIFTMKPPAGEGELPTAKAIPVKKGMSIEGRVVVTGEGLAEGLPVVTKGNEKLFPGQPMIPAGGAPDGNGKR